MKIFPRILSLIALTGAYAIVDAQTPERIDINFYQGMPDNVICIDRDGNQPASDLSYTGLEPGIAWSAIEHDGVKVACSTSWYSPAGQADDWMILPAIKVEEQSELRWKVKAFDMNLPDGYSVYVSTGGPDIDKFDMLAPLFTTSAENTEWSVRSVSLADYAGKEINIAFVNDSYDCHLLLIESIVAGTPKLLDIELDSQCIGKPGDELPVSVRVSSESLVPLTGLRAGLTVAGEETVLDLPDGSVSASAEYKIDFPVSVNIDEDEMSDVTVWVEHESYRATKQLVFGSFPKRIVAEEATGTWCAYCVSGIAAFEELKKQYSDEFIGICVHDRDPMAIDSYQLGASSFPQVFINREYNNVHPLDMENYIPEILAMVPETYVEAEFKIVDDMIEVESRTLLSRPDGNYNLAIVVIENDVNVPDNPGYAQKNAYAGGERGPMGGFEDKPSIILPADMWFQDVARCILDGKNGISGSVPSTARAGEYSTFKHTFPIPENVLDSDNVEVVVMTIDKSSKKIDNGCYARNETNGVECAGGDDISCRVSVRNGKLIAVFDDAICSLRAWTIDGCLIGAVSAPSGNKSAEPLEMDLKGYSGILIWNVETQGSTASGKIVI